MEPPSPRSPGGGRKGQVWGREGRGRAGRGGAVPYLYLEPNCRNAFLRKREEGEPGWGGAFPS